MDIRSPNVLNNQIVERLESGDREAAEVLLKFGVRPDAMIDRVERSPDSSDRVNRQSAWYWAHHGVSTQALDLWWSLVDRQLHNVNPGRRLELLSGYLRDTCEACMSTGHTAPLQYSWERFKAWNDGTAWTPRAMMSTLAMSIADWGNAAGAVVEKLHAGHLLTRDDWSMQARQSYAKDPATTAAERDQQILIAVLLDHGCDALANDGTPLLSVAWRRLREEIDKANYLLAPDIAQPAEVVEMLLARGVEWDVPITPGSKRTVSEDAQALMPILQTETAPHLIKLRHRIQQVCMQLNTPLAPPKGSSNPRF